MTIKTMLAKGLVGAALCATLAGIGCKSKTPEQPSGAEQAVDSTGLGGYDPVSYQTAGDARKGSAEFGADYDGTTYAFVDAESRDAFTADPPHYLPALNGFCIVCKVEKNRDVAGDPSVFSVYEGQLYLFPSAKIKKTFDGNPEKYAAAAGH